jgi:hypothetical protein
MTAKNGVARLALNTGIPVVPVAHWGEHAFLPYGEKKPRLLPPRKRIRFLAGPPVDLSAFEDRPITAAGLDGATRAIMADITALQAKIRGEEPPAEPFDMKAARRKEAEAKKAERELAEGEAAESDVKGMLGAERCGRCGGPTRCVSRWWARGPGGLCWLS